MVTKDGSGWKFPRKRLRTRMTSSFFLEEVDKIREERLTRGMACRRKTKRMKISHTHSQGDLFDALPDDILCSIISYLNSRDAIIASVLSRRWKNLWKGSASKRLDFKSKHVREHKIDEFVSRVNSCLALHEDEGSETESLRIMCFMPIRLYSYIVSEWVDFAKKKNVKKLELNFSKGFPDMPAAIPWPLVKGEESTLKHLSLASCFIFFPDHFPWDLMDGFTARFTALLSLTLKRTFMNTRTMSCILSECVSLEWLSIEGCYTSTRLEFKSRTYSPLKLKHLHLSDCCELKKVDIREAEALLSFEYKGNVLDELQCGAPVERLYFNVPDFDTNNNLNTLAAAFPHLETVLLQLPESYIQATENLPTFSNLKNLVLILVDQHPKQNLWSQISQILKASPCLHKLELYFPVHDGMNQRGKKKSSSTKFSHNKLKEVALYNFRGEASEFEVLRNMVNCGSGIENIEIHQHIYKYLGNGEWMRYRRPFVNITKTQVSKMLGGSLPAAMDLQLF